MDDGAPGDIEGYGSTFGNIDRDGDVIERGAFAETIAEHAKNDTMPAMLYQHSFRDPIGEWTEMRETEQGLYLRGYMWVEGNRGGRKPIPEAEKARNMMMSRSMRGMSIGFIARDSKPDGNLRRITTVDLWETSMVTIPANALAQPTSMKSAGWSKRDVERKLCSLGLSRSQARDFVAEVYSEGVRDSAPDVSDSVLDDLRALQRTLQGIH